MRKYKNGKDFEKFLRTEDYCPDFVKIGGIVFTMDNYDEEGKEISFGNYKKEKSFIIITDPKYKTSKNGFNNAVVEEIVDCDSFRNDIVYYE